MERRIINLWSWQDQFDYVQANEVRGGVTRLAFPELMVELGATAMA